MSARHAKYRRMGWLDLGLASMAVGAYLIFSSLEEHMVFFYSPSQVQTEDIAPDKAIRVGGLVVEGSVEQDADLLTFQVTDYAHELSIQYQGIPPALFREGQGMIAQGRFNSEGVFIAESLLAKHDENYMPPEVAEALKASGQWKDNVKTRAFEQE